MGTNNLTDAYAKYLLETKGIKDIRTLVKSGDGPNFIDLVIVSAGFTADQMGEFHKACEQLANGLLSQPPWNRYRQLFNVHAVFVEDESLDKTRVRVSGYKGNILSCDNPAAVEYARYAANARITVVIHNSTFSTSSCGYWGVLTLHKEAVVRPFTALHEVGHGFAGIGDEYIQRNTAFDPQKESLKDSVNVTEIENPRLSRWHYWMEETWPGLFGPLKRPEGIVVENAEGAGWVRGAYRPQKVCVMRCNTSDYCIVCNETLEANYFRYVDLFKSVEPSTDDLVLWKGETVNFRVTAMDILRQPPAWLKSRLELYMNGTRVGCSTNGEVSYQIRSATVAPGIYQIGANLNVQCDTIRRDFGFLSRNRGWRVTVLPYAKPQIIVKPLVSVTAGTVLDLPVLVKHERQELFSLKMVNAPTGAVLENGRFKWNTTGQTGSWRVDFSALNKEQQGVTESIEIQVKGKGPAGVDIGMQPSEALDLVSGTPFKLPLKASAQDGGHLLFEPIRVLDGVEVDRYTGVLTWGPRQDQAGLHQMRFRVKNGQAMREFDLVFRVRREAGPSLIFGPHNQRSVETLEKLRQSPIVYQRLFETLRLLRDRFDPVHQKALQEAKRLYSELDPQLQNTCLEELHLQAWTFANNPDILKWMREIAAGTKSKQAGSLIDRLDQIDRYNAQRIKIATEEDLRKQEERCAVLLGVVTTWQMSALYREEKKGPKELVSSIFAPEEGAAPEAGWVTASTYSDGILDLRNELAKAKVKGPYDDCAVYLRATLEVPAATEARLELGSDDGLKVWLNGKEVLARPMIRPLLPIQDKVDIQLKQGVNTLLLKVTQGGGDFQAYARIRDKEGKGLPDVKIGLVK
jgi:hypothetical protein